MVFTIPVWNISLSTFDPIILSCVPISFKILFHFLLVSLLIHPTFIAAHRKYFNTDVLCVSFIQGHVPLSFYTLSLSDINLCPDFNHHLNSDD